MKIAIIEDRIGRLDHFLEFDIKSYKNVTIITGTNFDKLILSLESKVTNYLDQFDCIASHRSALTNVIRDRIKEYCKLNNMPLIFFSGGITSSVFKDKDFQFLHINSKDFYSLNLKYFLENSIQYNSINLLMLQFGQKWKLSMLLNLRNNIAVAQNNETIKNAYPGVEVGESELIRRVNDLQINLLIKPDLLSKKTESLFNGNDYAKISNDQIEEVVYQINHLINDLI